MDTKTQNRYQTETVALLPYWEGPGSPFGDAVLPYLYELTKQDKSFRTAFAGMGKNVTLSRFIAYLADKPILLAYHKKDNAWMGYGFINEAEGPEGFRKVSVGFLFFRKYWGTEEVFEAGKLSMYWWFRELGVEIIYGSSLASNRIAVRFGEKLGFRKVGILPKFFIGEGGLRDGVLSYLERDTFYKKFGDE